MKRGKVLHIGRVSIPFIVGTDVVFGYLPLQDQLFCQIGKSMSTVNCWKAYVPGIVLVAANVGQRFPFRSE